MGRQAGGQRPRQIEEEEPGRNVVDLEAVSCPVALRGLST